MKDPHARRRLAAALALLVATAGLALTVGSPAVAAPRPLAAPGDTGDDGEGGSKSLTDQLDAASSGYLKARAALATSQKTQADLTTKLKEIDGQLAPEQAVLDQVINQTYRSGRLGPMAALLSADSAAGLLDRVDTLATVAVTQDSAVRALKDTRIRQEQAKVAIDTAIRDQQKQVNLMAGRKAQAEAALKAVGGGQNTGSPGGSSSGAATAPRYTGSGRTMVDDPTSSGRITARMLNALNQAQRAGFTHYVHCFRQQNSGEHPKGRACDFAADKGGFGGVATGASKDYGNRLAYFFRTNSDNLGVLYVIWFKRIWLPSSGWKSYSGGQGDPSSNHTNHVHLSVI
ncbi:MAG: peptidoglycan DL-endopeptidase CwlO [Actinoplanes sp.]|nr:peptidoglycan DL-endopeptidase CwlO [Actinoplanes sp.]